MLVKTKKGITICTLFDNETITLDDSLEWSIWLKNVRDLSILCSTCTKNLNR